MFAFTRGRQLSITAHGLLVFVDILCGETIELFMADGIVISSKLRK